MQIRKQIALFRYRFFLETKRNYIFKTNIKYLKISWL